MSMRNNPPSIFNDVIGPVMRGPSSSHTAASWRIARISLDILNEPLKKAIIEFDQDGAWAANYREQGTVMGINGGLLGLSIADDRMKIAEALSEQMGIDITYQIVNFPTSHTNTVRLTLVGERGKAVQIKAISPGGGAFEIEEIDHVPVFSRGDCFTILIWKKDNRPLPDTLLHILPKKAALHQSSVGTESFIQIKSSQEFPEEFLKQMFAHPDFDRVVALHPFLPVVSVESISLPFDSVRTLLEYVTEHNLDLGELGLLYEQCRSGLAAETLRQMMADLIGIIDNSIQIGLEGTDYTDRILHQQSHLIRIAEKAGRIPGNSLVNQIVANVTAIMEAKSAMEVIVAFPTAGSCGTVGGTLKAVADELSASHEARINACFASGLIGVFIAQGPGFSAEAHGCQVECGAASGMAAAGIVQLLGGTAKQAIDAASLALQNIIGMVCDPVADRVEVPCLGKNISAAMNALSSATMACSGFDAVIPLDEVLETITRVGETMPAELKCTGKGGLAVTPTALKIKEKL